MSKYIIKQIKNLSKIYNIGTISSSSFISDLNSYVYKVFGLADPNSLVNNDIKKITREK